MHQVLDIESLNPMLQRRLEAIFIGPKSRREPEIDELKGLIFELCNSFENLFIIVDGISEVEQDDRKLILGFLKTVQQSQTIIKLYITSRPEVDVPVSFNNRRFTRINIRARDTQSEINNFVDLRVDEAAINDSLTVCGSDMINKIKKALKEEANGMCDFHLINLIRLIDIRTNVAF